MLPNDDVSMCVGHLDRVLTVYSSMEHVTWKSRPLIDWDKAKVVDREAQRQIRWMRGTLDQEDTDMHEWDAGSYQLSHTWDQVISRSRAPSSCKQSTRRDQDVR